MSRVFAVGNIRSLSPFARSTGCAIFERACGCSLPQLRQALSWAKYELMEVGVSRSIVRSWSRARNALPSRLPFAVRVKKRNCFGSWRLSRPRRVSTCATHTTSFMPLPPAGPVPQLADQLRLVPGDHLGDHAAHGEPVKIDLVETQRA